MATGTRLFPRMGGTRTCAQCSEFETQCWPYVHTLLTKSLSERLKIASVTLFPNFAALEQSAKAGCDICRVWRKAILNEVYHRAAREALRTCELPIVLEPPTEIRSTSGLDIRIVSPVAATVKSTHESARDQDIKSRIDEDDVDGVELARRTGQVVRQVAGRRRDALYLGAKIEANPLDEQLWLRISRWLEHCLSKHASCSQRGQERALPSRLVHVLPDASSSVKIVDTSDITGGVEYIALSYCWGGEQDIKLTRQHEEGLYQGMSRECFPATVRDAFLLCRFLRIPYIWIDALCIYQDDNGKDFEQESRRMDKIYSSALLTLVVSSAESVQEGFLRPRLSEDLEIDMSRVHFMDGRLVLQRKGLAEIRAKSPLALRGWCLQEELLAKRLLYCTDHGFYWSCARIEFAENGNHLNLDNEGFERDQSITVLDPHSFTQRSDPLFAWDEMINQYSRRDLSIPQDRLPAVRGLAALVQQRTQAEYLHGMWISRLPPQLLWVAWGRFSASSSASPHESSRSPIPSWSWAKTSPLQAIRMPPPSLSHSIAKLLDVVEIEGITSLVLRGRLRPLLPEQMLQSPPRRDSLEMNESGCKGDGWAIGSSRSEIQVCEAKERRVVIQLDREINESLHDLACLEINYQGFLLVRAVGGGRYRRLGCAQLHESAGFFTLCEVVTITLS